MSIPVSVAKAIILLDWQVGQEYWTHTEWGKLRQLLSMRASMPEWRSLCANLVKNLVDLGVVTRGEGYYIEVVSIDPLLEMVREDDGTTAATSVAPPSPEMVRVRANSLPVSARVFLTREEALGLLLDNPAVSFQDIRDEPDFPGWASVAWSVGHSAGVDPAVQKSEALRLIAEGTIAFEDVSSST